MGSVRVIARQALRAWKVLSLVVLIALVPGAANAKTIIEIIDNSGDGGGNSLTFPLDIAVGGSGNVYITGQTSDNAFRIEPNGTITEIIDSTGDGAGNPLNTPRGIAADALGNAYVNGLGSNNVFRIDPNGVITEMVDSTGAGAGNLLGGPSLAIAVDDSGNLYVAGIGAAARVFHIDPNGIITKMMDSTGDGLGNTLSAPGGIAVDGMGNIYVAGFNSDNAFRIDPNGTISEIIDSTGAGGGDTLDQAQGIAVDAFGNVYVGGRGAGNRVFQIDPNGVITKIMDNSGDGAGNPLGSPDAIAVGPFGNIYVTGFGSDNVFQLDPNGVITEIIDSSGDAAGNFMDGPAGVDVDASGNVFVGGDFTHNAFMIQFCGDGILDPGQECDDGNNLDGDGCTSACQAELAGQPGTVLFEQKISDTQGGFTGTLADGDLFGSAMTPLGDLDGDGTTDLAVGARTDDEAGSDAGAVWVLFLDPNNPGAVKSEQKITAGVGGFDPNGLSPGDLFGSSVASLGDLDGDGTVDLAVGARNDDDGGTDRGALWVLFLDPNSPGMVKSQQKISANAGGFGGSLVGEARFGSSVSPLGDLDGDGTVDLAVGARTDAQSCTDCGALFVLFLDPNTPGTVKAEQKIRPGAGGFTGSSSTDHFGSSVTSLGDVDGDGTIDLAVGARLSDDGGNNRGSVWVLFLDPNNPGTVKSEQEISDTEGGFGGTLANGDEFGSSVASLGDLDGDGVTELAVGARRDDDGGSNRGAVWVLFLDPNNPGQVKAAQKISDTAGEFAGTLSDGDDFGGAVSTLGDLDGDGLVDLAVGTALDDDGGDPNDPDADRGALWVLFLNGQPPPPGGTCGDGNTDIGEECDDGNTTDGDGCSAGCLSEKPQSKDQQKCIVELNKGLGKVAKAQGKDIAKCIQDGSKAKLGVQTIEQCITSDPKGKVAKATAKTLSKETDKCTGVTPDYGSTSGANVNLVAKNKDLTLIHEIFGANLNSAIILESTNKPAAKCQVAATKQAMKCQDTKLKEFNACKKNGLKGGKTASLYAGAHDPFDTRDDIEQCMGFDLKNKINKACNTKLSDTLTKKCTGVTLTTAFPPCSTSSLVTLRSCIDQFVECQVCEALNAVDNLQRDCDLFDDALPNGSCP